MSNIVKYEHHGETVSVQEHLQGKHREHCLCYLNCKHFTPTNRETNCPIANAAFKVCVDFNVVSPIWECPKYEV